ncbi:hypothetical protein BDZ94DRAFT_1158048, partial [Collybia nuda]
GASMVSIAIGHQLDVVTRILSDFATINATAATAYPMSILVDEDDKPTGEVVKATTPDHFALAGMLNSGAISSMMWRGGYSATKGRRRFIWEIDGDEGSIKFESDGVYGAFLNLYDPDIYLDGEPIAVEGGRGTIANLTNAWAEFAKGEGGDYATIDDAVKNQILLDAIGRSIEGQKTITL